MGVVVVLIVGYCNPGDIADCLRALAAANAEPSFDVYIAENGGVAGMDMLLARLDAGDAAWRKATATDATTKPSNARRMDNYRLVRPNGDPGASVHVAEMDQNLGYAGGVNAWLRPLLMAPGWDAAWVLNPDTQPEPDALAELAAYSTSRGKAMVGSCIIHTDHMDTVFTRGLEWTKIASRVRAIDRGAELSFEPDPEAIEARLSAPSGASIYITRPLIEAIGLMDERYFLYCEELEWGERAQRLGMLGYAHRSRVPHKCGTTLGGTAHRSARSKLSVYLSARNTILFVKKSHPLWLPWTVVMQAVHLTTYGAVGAFANMAVGFEGLAAGLKGEVGRPDRFLASR
jgi:N-acetylglucosaminyl-diphospho-decaprenol L-rhamnosyltransferase